MSETAIVVDQFVAAAPERVWRVLTEPELLGQWWAPGDVAPVVGHQFHLQMPKWGEIACEVTHVDPPTRFIYTFNGDWTLDWRLSPEGRGTRLFLEHSGFDLDNPQHRNAFERMGPGWRDTVLPKLAKVATELTPQKLA
ncbi:SRPBCC domain-containing protein [Kribbella sp. NPDC051587]|uniref:SRPBCC domain-containing protein n=1 Tax=Kribbella sp. NPDC051587 TaxID=3364119 RepID=UPI0037BCDC33